MTDQDTLENLLPSLIQCFSVIFLGYLAVKLSVITTQATAIGTYVTKFALPALFFRSMATINFSDINWVFILAISLSKFILFAMTFLCTVLITKPVNFGMAGILSMFATQSNDVALGYPILLSLYPDLAKYIYLFAPAQLVLINPLCFILLECHGYQRGLSSSDRIYVSLRCRVLVVLKNVLLNPLVYMTVVGVIFNIILSHKLPIYLDKVLQILADSFAGIALFYLGMNMVGKISSVSKKDIYILVFLLLGKLIFLPFLNRELVVHLINLQTPSNQSLDYSLVAFLYGGLPTAPPVFLIAHNFQVLPDLIATGLVLGTFLSGPLMFISARVITMVVISKYQFDNILKSTAVSISVISLLACIWVLVVFLLSRRCKSPIHKVTLGYIFFVILTCSGVVIGRIFVPEVSNVTVTDQRWSHYFQFSIFFVGCVGARLCTVLIAAVLLIVKRNNVSWFIKNRSYFYIIGFCLPIIVTASLILLSSRTTIVNIDPSFQYGKGQLITSMTILTCSIVSTLIFLLLIARSGPNSEIKSFDYTRAADINRESLNVDDGAALLQEESSISHRTFINEQANETYEAEGDDCHSAEDICIKTNHIREDNVQINSYLALIIILVVTMGFGWFLCLWRLIKEELSGIYFELEFLDCVFNFGQGFILWTIFGFDTELIVIPFKKKVLKCLVNIRQLYIPLENDLSADVIRIRKQFSMYHLVNCRHDIVKDIRHMFKLYTDVFSGKNIIDWILKIGLANSRLEAISYARALLIGGVIEHIRKDRNLIDDEESLYKFTHLNDNAINSNNNADHTAQENVTQE